MADCPGSHLAGNPFPLSPLYIPLPTLWPVLGDWDSHKPNFRLNSLVFRQVVYHLGVFLGITFVVGDGGVWIGRRDIASFLNQCGRYSLRNKEISPKITIESWNLGEKSYNQV